MKPILEHLPVAGGDSFFATLFDYPYFPTPLHYHPEYELVLVLDSHGQRVIGNHVDEFGPGDLVLIGPNLPHLYRNAPAYYAPDSTGRARSIVVHFLPQSLGADFLQLPQLGAVRRLLEQSQLGLVIGGSARQHVTDSLHKLLEAGGLRRLRLLIEILDVLAESLIHTADCRPITLPGLPQPTSQTSERLPLIMEYLLRNLAEPLTLDDIASVAGLTRTSLCRYFRERTRRNLWDFLTELRLRHAAQRLRDTSDAVLTISLDSGFSNLSNFNRAFRQFYGCPPTAYRKQWRMNPRN